MDGNFTHAVMHPFSRRGLCGTVGKLGLAIVATGALAGIGLPAGALANNPQQVPCAPPSTGVCDCSYTACVSGGCSCSQVCSNGCNCTPEEAVCSWQTVVDTCYFSCYFRAC